MYTIYINVITSAPVYTKSKAFEFTLKDNKFWKSVIYSLKRALRYIFF